MSLDRDGYHDLPAGKIASVVTYLEMTEAPTRRVPDLPGLALRRVGRPELGWYRDLFRRIGADWLWFGRLAMPDAELLATIRHPAVEVWAVTEAGREEGLLELDRRAPPDLELAYLGVTPGLTGRGVGRWLMDRTLALAWAHNPRRVWVHTCTLDHPQALGFYLRSGFRAYARAVEVAADPRLTGLLPREAARWLPLIEPGPR